MAFFQLALKARKLEKVRQTYEDEKILSIDIAKGAKPRYTLKQRFRRRRLWFKKKLKHILSKIFDVIPKDAWIYKKYIAIRTEDTWENYVAKSFLGFTGGVILTCIVFLLLPQFFSKRGRQALMAYAFILALTGPIRNTIHNTAVLSESLACAQEQLREAVKTIVDLAKQPFYALRQAISKIIKTVKVVVKKIKQTLIAIKRLVLSILRVITSVFQWLGSVINMCNKKLGTPYDRCQSVFEGAVADCKAKLGPILGTVCNITYIVSALCYVVKPLDFICMLVSYIADTVVGVVRNKIKQFTMHVKAMFYVKVKFSHSFHFETNQSKTIEEVSSGIATEIRSRSDKLFGFFDLVSFVTSFFVFFIVLRVLHYRYKWLTNERFDNRYITDNLRTIDLVRARQDKETVLPLNSRERNRYAPLSSIMLIKPEKQKLASNVRNENCTFKVERPSVVTIHVSGEGYLSELYTSIVKAFTPGGKEAEIDTMLCLPDPIPPDTDKYVQIIVLIFFCWSMAFFEPYGLRLRHIVMSQYYPDRAKQRAAWLYNHILRTRGSFLKFARRQLRRKFGLIKSEKTEKVTLKERLWAMFPFLNTLFPLKQNVCLLCGAVERSADNPHIRCPTPGCIGLFCAQCFADLQNLCTICRAPMEYGDLSDMSEEKDSSDDQYEIPVIKPEIKKEKELEVKKEEEEERVEEEEVEDEDEDEEEDDRIEDEETEEKLEVKEREEKERVERVKEKIEEEETVEEIEKDIAEQTEDKYLKDLDRSTDSTLSYTYQEESPEEVEIVKRRKSFKDVEAQKIRDDVTIQIFNEPFIRAPCSSSDSPTSGFVVRARRKIRGKLKSRPCSTAKDSDSSTSIADTESYSTEDLDEEEIIHIEVGDSSEELLPRSRKDKQKLSRINRIVNAVARIPWLGKEV
ncbi:DC-STAMP domain-containing protein 2-like [Ceratina calcarata]|uniref:DC-STAMP domain-containing protein 2-like n=1 Tax=Ceratina calcarata TaxID=156304 RepID=A0AAJ7RW60_9HYME|nr:DC-STAMP domain-containing protein 2-like [Ceratina calcarata]